VVSQPKKAPQGGVFLLVTSRRPSPHTDITVAELDQSILNAGSEASPAPAVEFGQALRR
jgi:hypothetical protein